MIHYFFVHKFYFPVPPCPVYISVAIVLLLFASDINTYTHIVLSSLPVLRIASPLWCTLQSTTDHVTVSLGTNYVYTCSMLYIISYYSVSLLSTQYYDDDFVNPAQWYQPGLNWILANPLILILCIYLLKLLQFIALLFRSWFKAFIFLQDRHIILLIIIVFLPTVDMQPDMIAFLSIFSAWRDDCWSLF